MNGALMVPALQLAWLIVGATGVTVDETTGGAELELPPLGGGLELPPLGGGLDEQPVAAANVWLHEVGGVKTMLFLPTAVMVTVVPAVTLTVPAEAAAAAPLFSATK